MASYAEVSFFALVHMGISGGWEIPGIADSDGFANALAKIGAETLPGKGSEVLIMQPSTGKQAGVQVWTDRFGIVTFKISHFDKVEYL